MSDHALIESERVRASLASERERMLGGERRGELVVSVGFMLAAVALALFAGGDASVSLPVGAKVGLVGRNGVGKSTLFKLILGELTPDGGEIVLPKAARIGSVDQSPSSVCCGEICHNRPLSTRQPTCERISP